MSDTSSESVAVEASLFASEAPSPEFVLCDGLGLRGLRFRDLGS